MSISDIAARLAQLKRDIAAHAPTGGVRPEAVKIVAVTKYATPDQIAAAYHAGLRDFGENKVQDALAHIEALKSLRPNVEDVRWHFIGHLQSNKVGKTVGNFALVQSVDSIKIAEKIAESNRVVEASQPVLLQVSISGEASKGGLTPAETESAVDRLRGLPGIEIRGLMTMAPLPNSPDAMPAEAVFGGLRNLRDRLQAHAGIMLPELSMGMSKDYVPALQNGATIIRVGQYLFGSS